MAIIDKQLNKLSNVVVREMWRGSNYCRSDLEIKLALTGADAQPIQFGEVIIRHTNAAAGDPFYRVAKDIALPPTFLAAIIVDDRIGDPSIINIQPTKGWGDFAVASFLGQREIDWELGTEDVVTLSCIVRGHCIIREGGLKYGGLEVPDANKTKIIKQLQAQGITTTSKLQGDFLQPLPYMN